MPEKAPVEKIISAVGSVPSLVVHTLIFASSLLFALLGIVSWNNMLLVLTTIVSLEAIYLAIFIQMSVNRHAEELAEVSEDVEDIQEDIQEISEDVDLIQQDVDEIQEDVEEITEESTDSEHDAPTVTLEQLTRDLQRILEDLEHLNKR